MQQQHVVLTGGIRKNSAKTTGRLHQRNTITAMQQNVAFTGGIPK